MPRLIPCPTCHAHVRTSERVCPHCEARISASVHPGAIAALGLVLAGCPSGSSNVPEPEYGVPATTDGVDEPEYGVPDTMEPGEPVEADPGVAEPEYGVADPGELSEPDYGIADTPL